MHDFPQFESLPSIPVPDENEIWVPKWKCFCCHDTGLIIAMLAQLIIPTYSWRDKPPVCHPRKQCDAGTGYTNNLNYDQRFTRDLCDRLHKHSYDDWVKTVKSKQLANLPKVVEKLAAKNGQV